MSGLRPHIRAARAYAKAARNVAGHHTYAESYKRWNDVARYHDLAAAIMQAEHDAEYRPDVPDAG